MKRWILWALLLAVVMPSMSQYPTLRNFTNQEYQAGTQNWCFSQCSDGRVLFANNNGMLTFDGDVWVTHRLPNFTATRTVLFDYDRHVIFTGGTNEFGYFEANPKNYYLEFHSLLGLLHEQYPEIGEVWNIMRFGKDIVFQCKEKLLIYHPNNTLSVIPSKYLIEKSAVINNRLLIACKEGLFELVRGKMVAITVPGVERLQGQIIRSILPDGGGDILIATATDGLYRYDGQSIAPYVMDITPFIMANNIFCAVANEKYLVIGTVRNGAVVKDLQTHVNYYVNAESGLLNHTVLSAGFDRIGNIWLGLDNGIAYFAIDAPHRNLLGAHNHIGTGYASIVWGDQLILGTSQGLFTTNYPLANSAQPMPLQSVGNISGQIWNLRHVEGTLLCACDDGVYVVHGNSAEKVAGPEGTWDVRALSHHPGYVLACDYKGFYLLRKSGNTYVMDHRLKGFDESSAAFEEDGDGIIWVSHWQKGVWRLRLSDDLSTLLEQDYYRKANQLPADYGNILCMVGGKLYVSSIDGFRTYDKKTRKLIRNEQFNKLFGITGEPVKVMETPEGDLWAYRDKKLSIAHPQGKQYVVDSLSYGGIGARLQMGLGSIGVYDRSHTIFNYDNGFYLVDNRYKHAKQTFPLIIRSVVGISQGDTLLYAKYPKDTLSAVAIPKQQNSIRLEFVMPEYRDAKCISYTCLLEGYDHQWSLPQNTTSKEYTHLPKGKYTFRVKALDVINGQTSEAELHIEVLPAWYETWVAKLFYLLLALLAVYGLTKWLKRRADRELQRIKTEKERQLKEQEAQFLLEQTRQEKELVKLHSEQLEHELKHRSSELADSTMNLVRKNDMLQLLDESMSELSESVRREDVKSKVIRKINEIRHDIQANMNDDANWVKFEENFNLVYDNFMVKLVKQFPDLKKNDRKLCAYLRMGLSSKEMASLLNTSVRSIETARYRLRKKLNLPTGDNLTEFIQQFEDAPKE